ncbi:MAG: hypothetical protein ACI9WU_000130 [Myxococcota bacterium]|jgi:hypothetical protein
MLRAVLVCAVLGSLAADAHAGRYQLFTYQRDHATRVCRGDTTTGEALCVTGTGEAVQMPDGTPPRWGGVADVVVHWFHFPPRFTDQGEGLYQFFTYYQDKQPRICVGNTATSEAICVDGTWTLASARSVAPPQLVTNADRVVTALKYFHRGEGKAGDYGFAGYTNKNGARVCVMASATGDTHCTDGTGVFARGKVMDPVRWKARAVTLRWFRFFAR